MTATVQKITEELQFLSNFTDSSKESSNGWKALNSIMRSIMATSPQEVRTGPDLDKIKPELQLHNWMARYGVVFDDLPVDPEITVRIQTEPHYLNKVEKIKVEAGKATFSMKFLMMTWIAKTRPKMEWKDIDADTKKRVAVLDDEGKPVIEKLPPKTTQNEIEGKLTLPIAFFVDLLAEIGRDSLLTKVEDDYVPPVLGAALANILGGVGGLDPRTEKVMRALIDSSRRGYNIYPFARGYERDNFDMMMDTVSGYEMLGYGPGAARAIPCRLFLQPDDKGRMEIVAEPYSAEEIAENQRERTAKGYWSEWKVFDTNTVKNMVAPQLAAPTE